MDTEYIDRMFSVQGKVIMITGGGGILCGMMARELAKIGAKIGVLDIRPDAAQQVADEIVAAGGEAIAIPADVLKKDQVARSLELVLAKWGRVDALINGAGGNQKEATTAPDLSFFDIPEEAFRWVFDTNFIGMMLCCQVYAQYMAERGEGDIINIASVNSIRPLTKIPAYSAGKAAVKNFTEWLAVHMSQNYSPTIRINAIAPGFYITNQSRFLLMDAKTGQPTPRGKSVLDHTPMARFGVPEELMSTILYLLSPASSFVHGATILVDGGFTAFSGV
jgi:NAD(P)-dependent dehydrogenase (short-subunit alcohol dehydrogenase family)